MNALTGFPPMNSEILKKLVAERDQARQQVTAAERKLAEAGDYLRKLEEAIRAFRLPPQSYPVAYSSGETAPRVGRRAGGALTPQQIGTHAREFLIEAGKPLKRSALLRIFDEKGVTVVGGDRAKVLGTILWRAKNESGEASFVNTDRGYWPSDVPLPKV